MAARREPLPRISGGEVIGEYIQAAVRVRNQEGKVHKIVRSPHQVAVLRRERLHIVLEQEPNVKRGKTYDKDGQVCHDDADALDLVRPRAGVGRLR